LVPVRTLKAFPDEGVHTADLADPVLRLDHMVYTGDYSFEVFNGGC